MYVKNENKNSHYPSKWHHGDDWNYFVGPPLPQLPYFRPQTLVLHQKTPRPTLYLMNEATFQGRGRASHLKFSIHLNLEYTSWKQP